MKIGSCNSYTKLYADIPKSEYSEKLNIVIELFCKNVFLMRKMAQIAHAVFGGCFEGIKTIFLI